MIWIYLDTTADKYIAFDTFDAAATWFEEHDPEGVAFGFEEYEIVPFIEETNRVLNWRTVLKNGVPVRHGDEQACLRYVYDPVYREERNRSKQLQPGKPNRR